MQRAEIPNGHVPLAFLLGRRAGEYSLPSLTPQATRRWRAREAPSSSSSSSPSLFPQQVHLRWREEQATKLLARVLAQETRHDRGPHYESDAALEPPLARVSTGDRRRRAVELQRVLSESDAGADTVVAEQAERRPVADNELELYDQRARFAQFHGFAPRAADFVEVLGSHARIQRTQSVRQLHDDDKRTRAKQLKAKQALRAKLTQQLQQQQRETKEKLVHAEQSLLRVHVDGGDTCSGDEGEDERDDGPVAKPIGKPSGDVQTKQSGVNRWRDVQRQHMAKARELEEQEDKARHAAAQRARQESKAAVTSRLVSSQHEKRTMGRVEGVGPSFQSTLRVDEQEEERGEAAVETAATLVVSLGDLARGGRDNDGENGAGGDGGRSEKPGGSLRTKQHELFLKSRRASLHFGGGFASGGGSGCKLPLPVGTDGVAAGAVPLTKAKRQVLAEWKATLVAQ